MSTIELIIKDTEVLKMACRNLKKDYFDNAAKSCETAGLNMEYSSDTAKFRGCNVEAGALAVIAVLGVKPVISVLAEGDAYMLRSRISDNDKDLVAITSAIGLIKQRYAVERVLAEARNKQMRIQETRTETGVRLVLTSY
jgi:hypothetical protein